MIDPDVISHVAEVVRVEAATQSRFAALYRADVVTHAVPFVGDITTATHITVGVNPSATEFIDRRWPCSMTTVELANRLLAYFDSPVPPHPWFAGWEAALSLLGVSYKAGAAHLDLSPRATASMGSTDQGAFAEMISQDIATFFAALSLCRSVRGLLLAGCVTKRWYAHHFLRRAAPRFGFTLSELSSTTGQARTARLMLKGPSISLPVFFCSVSPSARQGVQLLHARVREHAAWIQTWPLRLVSRPPT